LIANLKASFEFLRHDIFERITMNKTLLSVALVLGAFALAPQAQAAKAAKPRIAVIEFTNNSGAAWWSGGVGWELSGMLSNELASTRAFTVLDRKQIQKTLEEQNLGASSRVSAGTGARMGKVLGAKYLVTGTVSAYEENVSDTGGGISFGGVSVGGKSESAYMAVDIQVIDAETGAIAYTRTVEGRSKGGGMSLGLSRGGFGGQLASQNKTPAGKAIRAALIEASDSMECYMVTKSKRCIAAFEAKEDKRRASATGALKLD
jgi:curli biogenesis system outer membrane secretion channel CsgG